MDKTFTLDQKEQAMLAQVDQERTQALAMVGALSLDMEQARKNLDTAAERQRSFIRQALANRGVERYENAQARNGAIVVTLPDGPLGAPEGIPALVPKADSRLNGPIDITKE